MPRSGDQYDTKNNGFELCPTDVVQNLEYVVIIMIRITSIINIPKRNICY